MLLFQAVCFFRFPGAMDSCSLPICFYALKFRTDGLFFAENVRASLSRENEPVVASWAVPASHRYFRI